MKSYNIEELNRLDIKEVLEAFGAKSTNKATWMHCANPDAHNDDDKKASLKIYPNNACKCFACGLSGNPVSVATTLHGDGPEGFKKGCEFLHDTFGVPYADGSISTVNSKCSPKKDVKRKKYWGLNSKREYKKVVLKDYLNKYSTMSKKQKLKLIYTFIYRFSLQTNQVEKVEWYKKRGLEKSLLLNAIGYLSKNDVELLEQKLKTYFSIEDLREFKLFDSKKDCWRYDKSAGISIVPSFDLYSDMVSGLMIRYTDNRQKGKEMQISCTNICYPLPFGLGRKTLLNSKYIWITEGHTDGLAIGLKGKSFASLSGTFGYKDKMFGLLKDKTIIIAFDEDKAGIDGSEALAKRLKEANINCKIAKWDSKYGNDLNELLKNNSFGKIEII